MKLHKNNIFALAERQLIKEYGEKYSPGLIIDYAIKIRHFMDRNAKFVKCILEGGEITLQALRYHNLKNMWGKYDSR